MNYSFNVRQHLKSSASFSCWINCDL